MNTSAAGVSRIKNSPPLIARSRDVDVAIIVIATDINPFGYSFDYLLVYGYGVLITPKDWPLPDALHHFINARYALATAHARRHQSVLLISPPEFVQDR